jgi:MarR family transcriptional regulator, protease production regulatory protein HPr
LYGKFPELLDMMCIIRNIYGDDFMEIFERSFNNIENSLYEENGNLKKEVKAEQLISS